MQLRSIVLYNHHGDTRKVDFRIGELNVITGESATGKSALLTIVEYCLGRDTMLVPVGPIADTVAWYAAIWELPGEIRAFVARPAPEPGRASSQRAMLEFGAGLEALPFDRLDVNTDTAALREQLGRRIGIEENLQQAPAGSLRRPLEAHLGHAALLCLQAQSEIASQTHLFHRQGEAGIDDALRDTIPFFLGAVPRDQAAKRAQLREARRDLMRLEANLRAAEVEAGTLDVQLDALLAEARAVGLLAEEPPDDRAAKIRVLTAARHAPEPTQPEVAGAEDQDRRRQLEQEQAAASDALRALLAERDLLLDQRAGESGYEEALELQAGRLASLGLLGIDESESGSSEPDSGLCPACGSPLENADPTSHSLHQHLEALQDQLAGLATARPAYRAALERVEEEVANVRARVASAQTALDALRGADIVTAPTTGGGRDFTRGRIDAVLARLTVADDVERQRLQRARESLARTVESLEVELSDEAQREQLTSRLVAVGRDMTTYADRLKLEHAGGDVRLNLARLTVVADTESGPAPLTRIGSAENWISYHVISHLALHRFFTRNSRPVPRLLMLDQPSQAYYPSDVARERGIPETDADREAVRRMFELLRDVVAELAPEMQVIVCDHANLPEEWFQSAVRENWRDGLKLIPDSWLA